MGMGAVGKCFETPRKGRLEACAIEEFNLSAL
jgi:hypothetical protein